MSFMSDLATPIGPGMAFASEGAFLARLYGNLDARRSFWNNAKNLLMRFIEQETPSVVGLQEMNMTDARTGTGTDAIEEMIKQVNYSNGTVYKLITRNVPANNAGLTLIYDSVKLGEVNSENIKILDNINQGGRPLLMALTDKGYLLATVHGAQDPKLRLDKDAFNAYMVDKNKTFIESAVTAFLEGKSAPKEIFIMGDFNDRYDGIKEFTIGNKTVKYNGRAPKSCCYNWDSSATDEDVEMDFGDGYSTGKEPPQIKDPVTGKLTLGDRGKIENYRYAGDKVFGSYPITDMKIFRPDAKLISEESDHELVYAMYNDEMPNEGGRRRRRSTRKAKKSKQTKKSKATRKH